MKVFDIPVRVDPSFLLLGLILANSRLSEPALLVEWLVVVFISILVHEFGHALTGKAYGLTPQIQLYSMGGLTSWAEGRKVTPPQSIIISLAGPFAGFLFGGLVYLLGHQIPFAVDSLLWPTVYRDLLWVNIGWGIFNLLPVIPMDGGHVVGSLEEWIRKKPGKIAHVVSLITAIALGVWALTIGWWWAAILMGWFAFINGGALLPRSSDRIEQLKL
ncbi:MAG TPA: M50 family metallopeptidase [Blastocatellia bacterium]|nr:M50 family metallopeptidase [Blastocatellia bacterium]